MKRAAILVTVCLLLAGLAGTNMITAGLGASYDYGAIEEGIDPDANDNTPFVPDEIIVKFKKDVADIVAVEASKNKQIYDLQISNSLDQLNDKHKAQEIKPLFKNFKRNRQRINSLLKKDKTLLTKPEKHILKRLSRAPKGAKIPALERIYKIKLSAGQSARQAVKEYSQDPDVEYAELNYIVSLCAVPDDPYYPLQWSLDNTGQDYPVSEGQYTSGTSGADINSPEAWDIHTGSSEVVVAVVDTGVDYNHRDLAGNMWVNEVERFGIEGIDDDYNGYVDDIYGYDYRNGDNDPIDDNGHGTHCAGIIAAEGHNGTDITGVSWDSKIMALKFMDSGGTGYTSDAVECFYYVMENGADVVSNSWGGGGYSQSMQDAIDYAYSQGVIMVAAAGNNNSSSTYFPARYDHVIAVAATDSNDEKASFSNYGDWVDIAAPGVDILSLHAPGTDMYRDGDHFYPDGNSNATMYIASGTSMACPHVAGAYALMLSVYPETAPDELEQFLLDSTDPISSYICASGRLNIHEAMLHLPAPKGKVLLDSDIYSCSSTVRIKLLDIDLAGNTTQQVIISTNGGDFETVLLTQQSSVPGIFDGTISTDSGLPGTEDGVVQISHGQNISVTYYDSDDGTGNPATVTDTAMVDCEAPVIFNVQTGVPGRQPKITFETDEPATARVLCGLACGGPYIIEGSDLSLIATHAIKLIGVSPQTEYFYIIEVTDAAGNTSENNNAGQCYTFTTTSPTGGDIYVPSQASTIQEAFDNSWDYGTVWVADGTYTGRGNRDIDFQGRPIAIRSENGPELCIIDCNGTETEPHRGFYFHSGEDANCVLSGFTITNGYIPGSWYVGIGGGILCIDDSNPTITNCIITKNSAGWDGGGICNLYSSPNINNCTFSANLALGNDGGAINNEYSSPTITNCRFKANSAYDWGGAIRNLYLNSATITNCIFTGNSADDGGGMFYFYSGKPVITNCTFAGNLARNGNAVGCISEMDPDYIIRITNSILADGGDEIYNNDDSTITITYSDVQGGWPGESNIDANPYFVEPGYWTDPCNTPDEPNDNRWNDGDYHLLADSPCIDVGDPCYIPGPNETDLDGERRIVGDRIDMGAYEANYIEVSMKFTPQALNLDSRGKWLKAHFVLPEGFLPEDVDTNTPAVIALLGIQSQYMNVFINEDGPVEIEAAFSRSDFCASATSNDGIEVIVIGLLNSGQHFYGTDTIRIIDKSLEYVAVLAVQWLEADCGKTDWCSGFDIDYSSTVNFVDFALFDGCCIEVIEE